MNTSRPRRNARRVATESSVKSSTTSMVRDSIIFVLLVITVLSLICHVEPTKKTSKNIPYRRETAYSTLGVDPFANHTEVAAAWRQRSEETHPDKLGHEEFQQYYSIQSAYYNIFIEPFRCSYDQSRGIQGIWAGKYKECDEILMAYNRAQSKKDREREQAAAEKANEEAGTSENTRGPLCQCVEKTHGEDTNSEALHGEDLVSVKEGNRSTGGKARP